MRKDFVLKVAAVCLAAPLHAVEQMPRDAEASLYWVAPNGNDAAPGTRERPWATLDGARRNLRSVRRPGGLIVTFADGTYPVPNPVVFEKADSGTPDCAICYRAAHPGKAVFTGAWIPEWRPLSEVKGLPESAKLIPEASRGHVLTAVVPGTDRLPSFFGASRYMQDELLVREEFPFALYAAGERLTLARWPNDGCARVSELMGEIQKAWIFHSSKSPVFGMTAADGSRPDLKAWQKEPDVWLHGAWKHAYADVAAQPMSIDPEEGLFALAKDVGQFGVASNAVCYAFNVLSELDRPGEWALDRASRRLYVWPKGDDPLLVARTERFVVCENVTDLTFEGFVFEYVRNAAVTFRNCRDMTLSGSVIRHTSGWGVLVEGGRGARVEGCDLYDLGEGGVSLEGGVLDTLTPSRHVVDNCHVHDYARLVWNYNPGVRLQGVGNEATHNLIHHAPHQACFFYGAENRFAWNVVHDVCRFTDDAGAIYSYNTHNAWCHRGNVIEHNVFHRVAPVRPHYTQLNGIYIDAFTSGMRIRNNIVSEAGIGIFSSGGQDNEIVSNLVVNAREAPIRRWNLGLMGGKTKFHHVIDGRTNDCDRLSYLMKPLLDRKALYESSLWAGRYPNQLAPLKMADVTRAHNSLYCRIEGNVLAACSDIVIVDEDETREQTVCRDNLAVAGDPGFKDFAGLDWDLRPESLAGRKLGDLRFREMGLYESPARISPAVRFGPDVTPPKPFNAFATQVESRGDDYTQTVRARVWLDGSPDVARKAGVCRLVVRHAPVSVVLALEPVVESLSDFDAFTFPGQPSDICRDLGNMYARYRRFDESSVAVVDLSRCPTPEVASAQLDAGLRSLRANERKDLVVKAEGAAPGVLAAFAAWMRRKGDERFRFSLKPSAFRLLPPGSVRAERWLLKQLELQRDGLTGLAEELYDDIGNSDWLTGGNRGGQYAWERGPYYLKGLVSLAYALDDAGLKAKAQRWIEAILRSQRANGDFGPRDDNWWSNMIVLHLMRDYYEATEDVRALRFLERYFTYQSEALKSRPLGCESIWADQRGGDELEVVLWLCGRPGGGKWMDLARLVASQARQAKDSGRAVNGTGHVVNFMQGLKCPALVWRLGGEGGASDSYWRAFGPNGREFLAYGRPDRMLNGSETLSDNRASEGTELCAIVERILSNRTIVEVSGDVRVADDLEAVAYNALPATLPSDLRGIRYYNILNQPVCDDRCHRKMQANGSGAATCPGPNAGYGCCRSNWHFGWPKFVSSLWMAFEGGLAAVAYGPCRVKAPVADGRVMIREETDYPFRERIALVVADCTATKEFTLRVRIPAWCQGATVKVNGQAIGPVASGAFADVRRTWRTGDRLDVNLPMRVVVTDGWSHNSSAVTRGPLVFARPISGRKERIENKEERGFAKWRILPTEKWNDVLVCAGRTPSWRVRELPVAEQPFDSQSPAVVVDADGASYSGGGWGEMVKEPGDTARAGEPPWDVPPQKVTKTLPLQPVGATELRLTLLPVAWPAKK